MITGNNYIYYEAVSAYSISPQNARIFSGGGGDHAVTTQGTRFFWTYDPEGTVGPGFTGVGWFEDLSESPLKIAGKTGEQIEAELRNGDRTDLTDVFEAWQTYVNEQAKTGNTDVVTSFVNELIIAGGYTCWNA